MATLILFLTLTAVLCAAFSYLGLGLWLVIFARAPEWYREAMKAPVRAFWLAALSTAWLLARWLA